jgi:hypothetical protein
VEGITLHRFTISPTQLFNSTLFPSNADYYMNQYNGLLDCTKSVSGGLPTFFSKPHFLGNKLQHWFENGCFCSCICLFGF